MTDIENLFSGCEAERKKCSDSRNDDSEKDEPDEDVSLFIGHED